MKCLKARKNGMGNSNLNVMLLPLKLLCQKYFSYLILFLLVGIIYSLLNTAIIMAKSSFVDEAADLLNSVMAQKRIWFMAGFLGLVSALEIIGNGIYNFMYVSLSLKMQGEIQKTIFQKINRLSPLAFETSENLERIKKAPGRRKRHFYHVAYGFFHYILLFALFYNDRNIFISNAAGTFHFSFTYIFAGIFITNYQSHSGFSLC